MKVSAIVVTRGDVDLVPVLESLPDEWEKVVWENGGGVSVWSPHSYPGQTYPPAPPGTWHDFAVYGRYAAIAHATGDVIYVQDDDVIVGDPQAIVDRWVEMNESHLFMSTDPTPWLGVVCNMPQEFRHGFYREHALVGFGAAFHRDSWSIALGRFADYYGIEDVLAAYEQNPGSLLRCCDVVFTGLTPRVLVDVPKENMPYASDDNRMWKQPQHQGERARMLELVLRVREDAP